MIYYVLIMHNRHRKAKGHVSPPCHFTIIYALAGYADQRVVGGLIIVSLGTRLFFGGKDLFFTLPFLW